MSWNDVLRKHSKVIHEGKNYLLSVINTDSNDFEAIAEDFGYQDNRKFINSLRYERQRPIVQDRVEELQELMVDNEFYKSFNARITFVTINGSKPTLIDGQHRLSAMVDIKPCMIEIATYDVPSLYDLHQCFVKINSNVPVNSIYLTASTNEDSNKLLATVIMDRISEKFAEQLKISEKYGYHLVTKDDIYDVLDHYDVGKRESPLQLFECETIIVKFVKALDGQTYDIKELAFPKFDKARCQSTQRKGASYQCVNRKKTGDYCGRHGNGCHSTLRKTSARNACFNLLKDLPGGNFMMYKEYADVAMDSLIAYAKRMNKRSNASNASAGSGAGTGIGSKFGDSSVSGKGKKRISPKKKQE